MEGLIEIEGYKVHCTIGVHAHEKEVEQELSFDVAVKTSIAECVKSDDVEEAIDWDEVMGVIKAVVRKRHFHLLEAMTHAVAEEIMAEFPISYVRVKAKKSYISLAASTSVTVEKYDTDHGR